ncbi:Pyridine nucleotide-disulfide oxidoreductase domain-containing protein 1 [Allomyces arbusculus]|nr:Pyridine nucleotide-disulfide oxidoreductase domain-containing protein 1 [Allomyces arbusculus]
MVKYVVLGGGVAGVTCAEELSRLVGADDEVFLISQSRILKVPFAALIVTNVQAFSKTTETFDLVPTDLEQYRIQSRFHVLQGTVARIDRVAQHVVTASGTVYPYDKLCIATGGRPHVLFDNPHVMAIRDIESVEDLCARLSTARRIMVVGNGGIALELLNEIRRIPIVWAIKDNYLGNTFLDAEASAFFEPHLFTQNEPIYSRILAASPAQTLATPPLPARTNPSARPLPAKPRSPPPAGCDDPADSTPAATATPASRKRKNRISVASPPDASRRPPTAPAAPGASLGPVWRASLVLPPPPPIHAAGFSDRDLVIERECHVDKVWTADEFRRRTHKKKRRTESGPPSAIDRSDDEEDVVLPAPPPVAVGSVEFVPHMGRFGEGRLGLVPKDEVGEADEDKPVPFPGSSSATSMSVSGASTPTTAADVLPKNDWPLYVQLSNKHLYGVDLLISATGVVPNSELAVDVGLDVAPAPAARTRAPTALDAAQAATAALTPARGGIAVDKGMRTSDPNIYAAGDCAACVWADRAAHWFQMRLWSQARSMGLQAARSMVRDVAAAQIAAVEAGKGETARGPEDAPTTTAPLASSGALAPVRAPPAGDMHLPDGRVLPAPLDVHFDLFAHVSRFFGFKVVLLGRFNAQGLAPGTYDVMVRSSHAGEYVKVVKDRATKQLQGAMLIGETDLEELFENLILTRADVSFLDDAVLDPDVDLDAPVFDDEPLGAAGDAFGHDDFDLALAYGPSGGGGGGGGTGVGGVMSASASPALVDVGGSGVGDDVALF